jgi:ribosomal protein L28
MAYRCDICDKRTRTGKQHTHHTGVAGGQWKKRAPTTLRKFAPNLHWVSLPVKGVMTRFHACAKCIKRMKFDLAKTVPAPQAAA